MAGPAHSISSLGAVEGVKVRQNAEAEKRSKVEAMQEEGERKEKQRPRAGKAGRRTGSGRLWGLQITRNNSRSGGLQALRT